jgi:enterochelin esterase family protein
VIRTLHDLRALQTPSAEAIDAFLEGRDVPIVDGTSVTFLYRGEAEAVTLQHFIWGLETSLPFTRIDGTDLWFTTIELPRRSRIEYKLLVTREGGEAQLIRDPLNPHLAHDPYGANSVCHGEGYTRPEWTNEDEDARPGVLEERALHSRALGGNQRVRVYLPARYRPTRRYPLLIVHDGGDYLAFSALKTVLDNLIHRLEIPSMIVALTYPGDRLREYADDPRHARFLVEELLPALEEEYPLIDRPDARGLMGASFGGVASLSTAWRHPGVFGRLLLQSGSFAFTDIGRNKRGETFEPVVAFVNAFRKNPGRPSERVYVSCGTYESLIYENRSLVPLLQRTGMDVRFVEARDGHNWENWRDRLREGLSWLFPGPLWLVYE